MPYNAKTKIVGKQSIVMGKILSYIGRGSL